MLLTHLSAAMAMLAVLFLTTAATAVAGSSTRNIVNKYEEPQEQHRAMMAPVIGLNQMECQDSLEPKDGSIVCTFRVMPPAATTTTSNNNPKLLHDCLFTSGSNFCLTTAISRATYDQANPQTTTTTTTTANQQTAVANPLPPLPLPPPLVTIDAELVSTVHNYNIIEYNTTQNINHTYSRSALIESLSYIRFVITFSSFFLSPFFFYSTTHTQTTYTQSSAVVPTNTAPGADPVPVPVVVLPSRTETIQLPTPVNGPNCPLTAPSTGDACSWVTTNKFSAFQCGYVSPAAGTFLTICKCDAVDRFVCGPAVTDIYNRVSETTTTTTTNNASPAAPPPLVTIDAELVRTEPDRYIVVVNSTDTLTHPSEFETPTHPQFHRAALDVSLLTPTVEFSRFFSSSSLCPPHTHN